MRKRSGLFRNRAQPRRGIGTIVGMLFFVLIVIIAITFLITIYSSFTNYVHTFTSVNTQMQLNDQTSLSISSMNFTVPAPTVTGPSTIDTSTTKQANAYSEENKLIYAQGLWWSFYSSGSTTMGDEYRTSSNGVTWSPATSVITGTGTNLGQTFTVYLSGTTIYYALSNSQSSNSFTWRYGTLNSDGTITWAISAATVATTYTANKYISMVTDGSGNVWVALSSTDGNGNYYVEVWKYTSAWSSVDTINGLTTTSSPILLSVTSGIVLIYGNGGTSTGTVHITTTATGSVWSSAVSPASNYALLQSSAFSAGNIVYFAGMAGSGASGTVRYWNFTYGGASTTAETTVQSSTSGWYVSISQTGTLPNTFLIFYGSGSNMYYAYSTDQGAVWSSQQTISTSENKLSGISSSNADGGIVWTSGASSPYNVRFAVVTGNSNWQITPSFQNSSPFAVHLISLYVYDTNTSSLVAHFDTNSSAPGVSGQFDLWIGAGQPQTYPSALTFNWTHKHSYLLTVTTDQGIVISSTFVAPT
jgi:hypothetical protein